MKGPIAIVGDLHFGIKDSCDNYVAYQSMFFEDILFPKLKADNIKNIVILGDIFHNRKTVNIKVVDKVKTLFNQLSEIVDNIYITLGNHDFYYKTSYEISFVETLLAENPKIRTFGDKAFGKSLFVKYKTTRDEYVEFFKSVKNREEIEYIYGHFDLVTFMYNAAMSNNNEFDLKAKDIRKYFPNLKKVFTGHYHSPQEKDFIKYLGVPYELTWSEAGQNLGFCVLKKDDVEFIKNPNIMYNKLILPLSEYLDTTKYKTPYKQVFKIIYNDSKQFYEADRLNRELTDLGHNCIVINMELFKDPKISNDTMESSDMNIEHMIKEYIDCCEVVAPEDKEEFLAAFMNFYEQTKNEITTVEF